jgi:hypothetical protein
MTILELKNKLEETIKDGYGHLPAFVMAKSNSHPSGYIPVEVESADLFEYGGWVTTFGLNTCEDVLWEEKNG